MFGSQSQLRQPESYPKLYSTVALGQIVWTLLYDGGNASLFLTVISSNSERFTLWLDTLRSHSSVAIARKQFLVSDLNCLSTLSHYLFYNKTTGAGMMTV